MNKINITSLFLVVEISFAAKCGFYKLGHHIQKFIEPKLIVVFLVTDVDIKVSALGEEYKFIKQRSRCVDVSTNTRDIPHDIPHKIR